jgi:hypothetical protein
LLGRGDRSGAWGFEVVQTCPMTSGSNVIVARPHSTKRLVAVTAGPLLTGVGLAALLWKGNLLGAIFVVAGLYLLSDLWRHVAVSQGRLVAQGRVSRRGFDLTELRQVAVSPMSVVWVHANNMPAFYLRMLAESTSGDNPGIWDFPSRLRAAAEATGATPEPAPTTETTPPPEGIRPVFSW